MRVRTPCSSSTGIVDLPLDDYGCALISYSGTGTVTWEHGSSNALTFNAAPFPDGRIVVLGHYANDNAFR
jgi:hypothetical protein